MKRIRSKQLWAYLDSCGALASGDPAIIEAAKLRYRKEYKKTWKKNRQVPRKEIRPSFSEKDYATLLYKARVNGFQNATAYVSEIALAIIQERSVIPHKDILLEVLQQVGMSHIALDSLKFQSSIYTQLDDIQKYLKQAEDTLNKYLHIL